MTYHIKFERLEGPMVPGGTAPPPGVTAYLAWYDPDASDGLGEMIWTTKVADALRFATQEAAVSFYLQVSQVRPVRPDGQPNRPLTAFTVSIVPGTSLTLLTSNHHSS